MNEAWLENLKVGDTVIVHGREQQLGTVKRITPSLVYVDGCKYSRRDGRRTPRDRWNHMRLYEATPDEVAEIRQRDRRRALVSTINHHLAGGPRGTLPTDTLEAIVGLLKAADGGNPEEAHGVGGVDQVPYHSRRAAAVKQVFKYAFMNLIEYLSELDFYRTYNGVRSGKRCYTDGHALVCIPTADADTPPAQRDKPTAWDLLADHPGVCAEPWPLAAMPPCRECNGTGQKTCDECHGGGVIECPTCGHDAKCQACSKGKVPCTSCKGTLLSLPPEPIVAGTIRIAPKYAALVATMPNARFSVRNAEIGKQSVWISWDGGIGIIMGVVKWRPGD